MTAGSSEPTPSRSSGSTLLSVIMVTYNSADYVAASLQAAQKAAACAQLAMEIVVIDNASTDGSAQVVRRRFPNARVISNSENVGFAAANNQAFELVRGDLVLLVNPDALVEEDALAPLVDFLRRRPRAGAVAPTLEHPWARGPEGCGMNPGIRSMVGHYFFLNRVLPADRGGPWRGVMLQRRPHLGPRRVDWLAGAVMLVRREAVRDANGFDTRFFLYSEDVDFGERLRRAGWELWIVPDSRARHVGAQGRVSARWVDAQHDKYASEAPWAQVVVFDMVLALGLTPRALAWRILRRSGSDRPHADNVVVAAKRAWQLAIRTLARVARGQRP